AFVGNGRVTAIFKKQKSMKSNDFERSLAPKLAQIPDARVSFRSNNGWGGSGRDLTITLGGDDPKVLSDTAIRIVGEMQKLPALVAPRITGDLQRPEIVIKPRMD